MASRTISRENWDNLSPDEQYQKYTELQETMYQHVVERQGVIALDLKINDAGFQKLAMRVLEMIGA